VSIVHEALLREWQRVTDWLKQNREFLRMRDRLDASMRQWKLMERHRNYLFAGWTTFGGGGQVS
jgi:hypothetical protein